MRGTLTKELSFRNTCWPAVACLLVVGCATVGPDYERPAVEVADTWRDIKEEPLTEEWNAHAAWWTAFDDPDLTRLVEQAYGQNLGVRGAAVRILEARALLGVARGMLYPQQQYLRGGIGYTATSENSANSALGDLDFTEAELAFEVAWELDIWGKLRLGVEAADAAHLASVASYDDMLVSLMANVATAYTLVRTFEQRIVIAGENAALQRRSVEIADVRFRNRP
jgi:outer membrane protein TolC